MTTSLLTWAFPLTLTISVFGFGCSSSSGTTPTPDAAGSTPTLTEVYADVITAGGCPACHNSTGEASFLPLDTQADFFKNTVSQKAGSDCASSGMDLIVPSDAATSLLYLKVTEAKPPCGGEMPLGKTALSATLTGELEAWITAGAKND